MGRGFGQKVHVPFGTNRTHFGEYGTQNTFEGKKQKTKKNTFLGIQERALGYFCASSEGVSK